jgi:hypothetical protein
MLVVVTLANKAAVAASAHDWPEATRQLKEAITECGDCAVKADLHKKLGLIDCQSGNIENGEKELLVANALKPAGCGRRERCAYHGSPATFRSRLELNC